MLSKEFLLLSERKKITEATEEEFFVFHKKEISFLINPIL